MGNLVLKTIWSNTPYLFKTDTVQNARETVVTVILRKMLQKVAIKNEFKFNDKRVRMFQV